MHRLVIASAALAAVGLVALFTVSPGVRSEPDVIGAANDTRASASEPLRIETAKAESSPLPIWPTKSVIRAAPIRAALQASANRAVGPVRFGQGPLSLNGDRSEVLMPRGIDESAGIDVGQPDNHPGRGAAGFGRIGSRAGYGTQPPSGPMRASHKARLRPGKPIITDGLRRADVKRVVRRRAREAKFCFERAVTQHPQLAGTLTIQWTILPDGAVGKVRLVEDGLKIDAVGRCIMRVIKRWTFPRPDASGSVQVTYPFTLKAPKTKKGAKTGQ